jgi:predicted MFS family arabinose efflux permease
MTGVRTAALQFGYFVGAAVGGLALAAGGFTALGLTLAALFVGATIPHVSLHSSTGPASLLP